MATRDALWASGYDESVEVNQRALIDKVLARYSGEFTIFRELLQNSDDARSQAVEIHFETRKYLEQKNEASALLDEGQDEAAEDEFPDLKSVHVHQWTFKNNGIPFRQEDWNRLKKIAEGNPDEEKIGAFGVGFYSLFNVTDEPFVTSGGQWMSFYWKDNKDQLFVRRGSFPDDHPSKNDTWTTFEMSLRKEDVIYNAFDFTRFLASSITFMEHLQEVSVFFDDKRLARLSKTTGVPSPRNIPRSLTCSSPGKMMNVTGLSTTALSIKAEVMRWTYAAGSAKPPPVASKQPKPTPSGGGGGFFKTGLLGSLFGNSTPQVIEPPPPPPLPPKKINLLEVNETNVTLSIFSADVAVKLPARILEDLRRATKKEPPSRLKYKLIYTAKDKYDVSVEEDKKTTFATGSVFQGLRADLEGGAARIFIGHATAQSTGIGGHMAARFIPTVEREAIDLVDRDVSKWNRELLYIGGFIARSVYELEMDDIRGLWKNADERTALMGRAVHAMKFFAFRPSAPSADVSSLLEQSFFSCSPAAQFPLMSSSGVVQVSKIRLPDLAVGEFLPSLPVLAPEVSNQAKTMVAALEGRNMIRAISFADILAELKERPLNEKETVAMLKWCVAQKEDPLRDFMLGRGQLLEAAILVYKSDNGTSERVLPLGSVHTFLDTSKGAVQIPPQSPLPEHVLPHFIAKEFKPNVLASTFPWRQLTILEWLRHITDPRIASANPKYDLASSDSWAEHVLKDVLAHAWTNASPQARTEIVELLSTKTCVPTTLGMKLPGESYFANVNVFQDLPIVKLPSGTAIKGKLETVLERLGVRKHVDLAIVFSRIKTGDWTIERLMKYLVTVKGTLTTEELKRLRETYAFRKEPDSSKPEDPATKYRACDLFEPTHVHRQLGLPILQWGTQPKWRSSLEEAKFLFGLGLKRYPPLKTILSIASSPNVAIRSVALKYFLDNHATRYSDYNAAEFKDLAYVPALDGTATRMGRTREVYANADWGALGFLVVQPEYRDQAVTKLQIREHPPAKDLISFLEKSPPRNKAQATQYFRVLGGVLSEFSPADLRRISEMPIVPTGRIVNEKSETPEERLPPNRCYFESQSRARFHSLLFTFVDFGPHANNFLAAVGTKNEPSVEEIAAILLQNPRRFYDQTQSRDNFLIELRNIAINSRNITSGTLARMKRAPILLCSQRKPRKHKGSKPLSDDLDEEEWELQYDLRSASDIKVVDDPNAYQLFGDSIFTAPQEDLLEEFYILLGSQRLSSIIREDYDKSAELKNHKAAVDTHALILERLPLFLHEHTHSKTRVPSSWLSNPKNLVVQSFGKLSVKKSLRGTSLPPRTQDISAAAHQIGTNPIELWLAAHTQVDMYEVATSLCRLLFTSPKVNDSLLFMTILSTDLRALKRRGYNVDRILKQQKAQKLAADEARKAAQEGNSLMTERLPDVPRPASPPPSLPPYTSRPGSMITAEKTEGGLGGPADPLISDVDDAQTKKGSKSNKFQERLQSFGRKIKSTSQGGLPTLPAPPSHPDTGHEATHGMGNGTIQAPDPSSAGPSQAKRANNPGVTPQSRIGQNIDMAIKACTQESGDLVHNRERMEIVNEALNESYCDVTPSIQLDLAGNVGDLKFFVSREVPDAHTVMHSKVAAIDRFTKIIHPLARIYKLPTTSLHIFFDTNSPMIAFNRGGSLFLNLRFYENWHDKDVAGGILKQAYISWFFTLAHEIAHNLVQAHNSEHEFYMSAICQQYVVDLANLLSRLK